MAEQGKQKASLISILLNTVSSLLAFGGIILIVYFINEGWYPTGYNVEHTEGGTIFLERGWKNKETLVIEEEASENLRDVSSMAAISISNYKSAFMGMASSFYSFYIAFIPVLFHLKKWDKKKVNKRLFYSAFLLFLTALITYQTMNIHTGVEEDCAEVEQQIEEEEETARSFE
ncbi:hypothetical protein [Salibacterium aidingense]|uniref:hypothetical protein n=1 Tax=Salibacterium aidingense TaxID=384933 RepID=UPI000420FE32|nr:hypothetical protein [Salibacterium aidingense]